MDHRSPALMGAVIFSFLLPCLLAGPTRAADLVENGDQPAQGRAVLTLEEMWRIGGDDDEDNLLGLVAHAVADEDGNVYLLDTQLVEVLVYDRDGQYVRSVGREGDGPGETRRPRDLILLPDGTVGLVQGFPGKIIKLERDGVPAGELAPGGDPVDGGFFALRKAMSVGQHLVLAGTDITRDEHSRTARTAISRFSADGTPQTEYFSHESVQEMRSLERSEAERFVPDTWTVGPDGRVYIPTFRNAYHIDVYAPDGTLDRTVTRSYEPCPRTADEIERQRTSMTPYGRAANRDWDVQVESTLPDIMQLHVDEAGRLWVLSSRGARSVEPGVHSVWDVFDAEGRFEQEIALACEGVARDDGIIFPGHGLVLVVKELQDAVLAVRGQERSDGAEDVEAVPLSVICYRLPAP